MQSYKDPSTGAVFEYGPRSLRGVGHEARSSMALVSYNINGKWFVGLLKSLSLPTKVSLWWKINKGSL